MKFSFQTLTYLLFIAPNSAIPDKLVLKPRKTRLAKKELTKNPAAVGFPAGVHLPASTDHPPATAAASDLVPTPPPHLPVISNDDDLDVMNGASALNKSHHDDNDDSTSTARNLTTEEVVCDGSSVTTGSNANDMKTFASNLSASGELIFSVKTKEYGKIKLQVYSGGFHTGYQILIDYYDWWNPITKIDYIQGSTYTEIAIDRHQLYLYEWGYRTFKITWDNYNMKLYRFASNQWTTILTANIQNRPKSIHKALVSGAASGGGTWKRCVYAPSSMPSRSPTSSPTSSLATCASGSDCTSGYCANNICTTGQNGVSCDPGQNGDCFSGYCDPVSNTCSSLLSPECISGTKTLNEKTTISTKWQDFKDEVGTTKLSGEHCSLNDSSGIVTGVCKLDYSSIIATLSLEDTCTTNGGIFVDVDTGAECTSNSLWPNSVIGVNVELKSASPVCISNDCNKVSYEEYLKRTIIETFTAEIGQCYLPSLGPSSEPSVSYAPSVVPSSVPSASPSKQPSVIPSDAPSSRPTASVAPSDKPSGVPSVTPSNLPSLRPSSVPSAQPVPPLSTPTGQTTLLSRVFDNVLKAIVSVLFNLLSTILGQN